MKIQSIKEPRLSNDQLRLALFRRKIEIQKLNEKLNEKDENDVYILDRWKSLAWTRKMQLKITRLKLKEYKQANQDFMSILEM